MTPSLRQLRAAAAVARRGNISRAADDLNRTQSAVTRSVQALEARLGCALFERKTNGVSLTRHGRRFLERYTEIEQQFALAASVRQRLRNGDAPVNNALLRLEVSGPRLEAFLALRASGDVASAAARLGVTRATIYGALSHLENLLEIPLFEHGGGGSTPTRFGHMLGVHLGLALSLARQLEDDLASLDGETHGRIVIGTLPYSRTLLTPRAIDRLLKAHPQLHIATREGPYETLEDALRCGELDLIIGAVRELPSGSDLVTETLFEDELSVITAADHPLAHRRRVEFSELLEYGWVLPLVRTPARQLFDRYLADNDLPCPRQVVESSSLSLIRGLLLESDRLALLSSHQVHYDERAGHLVTLPIQLPGTRRPIGLTLRGNTAPSPAALGFIQQVRRNTPWTP